MSEAAQENKSNGWYRFARVMGGLILHTICPARYHHVERITEREGAFIMIGNHDSMFDPVALAYPIKKRDVTFLGKKELTTNKLLAKFFDRLHMIVVDRHNSDMRAMRACIGALRKGQILGIFPEGTRHHEGLMKQLESGVALMTLQSKVPLVPVYITPRIRPFRRINVYVGEEIAYDDLLEAGVSNETSQALLERITATYEAMAEAAKK